ncbi:MAG: hypothetical protein K2Y71_26490 [Xanthobacteraceae bacterium]|nr:hypothetical protein [Xanthobacteraceae bacterium]
MFSARSRAVAATALSPIAGVFLAFVIAAADARAQGASPVRATTCEDAAEIAVLPSPIAPWRGAPLRVLFAAEKPLEGRLTLVAPNGSVAATSNERFGGPPYSWFAEVPKPVAGKWQVRLTRADAPAECATITREVVVLDKEPPKPRGVDNSVWPIRDTWNRSTENLYSAWIEKMFDAPLDATLSWPALHEVLRDRSRNFLHNHLGLNEDSIKMFIRPDCADLPYFLRAYFAFKIGLPYGYAKCTRGSAGGPPKCFAFWNIQNLEPPPAGSQEDEAATPPPTTTATSSSPFGLFSQAGAPPANVPASKAPAPAAKKPRGWPPKPAGLVPGFGWYLQRVADAVHSGAGRTALEDINNDFYPVPLTQDTLRPGTVYADPYGHLLILVKRVPQTESDAGVILAVDAQPDGTVARKRFWRGNFLFAQDPALGGPGFKRFRPIVRDKSGLRRLTFAEIAKNAHYSDFSTDQGRMSIEAFYDRMDDVMSPSPLDPLRAMKEAIAALEEQVKARVTSVENGRKFQNSGKGEASMPDGAAIFETTGPWEDFSTPSRDLRLLIAIDVVRTFPERVARRPERYAMPAGQSIAEVTAQLQRVLAQELSSRTFSYPRSDGSPWTLSVKDVVDRVKLLEMAYNPNDCVELRWGAAENSDEARTCKRFAPRAQRAKMTEYRAWFSERRRPPRS